MNRVAWFVFAFCCTAVAARAQFNQPLLSSAGVPAHIVTTNITAVSLCSSNVCTFQPGTTNAIGQATAALSSGTFAGTFSISTAGTATNPAGASCPNNSAYFTISSSGLLSSTASSANQTYTICVAASQPGLGAPNPYIQVVTLTPSSGLACAIGQPYTGSVPAGAAAAGFTTCALNVDMSQTYYQTLSNWLDCSYQGGTAAVHPIFYSVFSTCPSSETSVIADGSNGVALKWVETAGSYGEFNTVHPNHNQGQLFPQTLYVEIKFRLDSTTNANCGNVGCAAMTMFDYYIYTPPSNIAWQEWDWAEIYSYNLSSNFPKANESIHNTIGSFSGGAALASYGAAGGDCSYPICGTVNFTQLHTLGWRIVSDGKALANGSGAYSYCSYVDNVFKGCNHGTYTNTATGAVNDVFQYREVPILENVDPSQGLFQNGSSIDYLYSYTIFECANWNSNPAPTVISGRGPLAELGNNCLNTTAAVTGALTGSP